MSKTILAIVILAVLAGMILPVFYDVKPVYAAGNTTVTLDNLGAGNVFSFSVNAPFSSYRIQPESESVQTENNPSCGWWEYSQYKILPKAHVVGWDSSTIPDDAQIVSAKIIMKVYGKYDTNPLYSDFYWSFYKSWLGSDDSLDVGDNARWYALKNQGYGRATAVKKYSDLPAVGSEYEVEISQLEEFFIELTNNRLYAECMTENQGLLYNPGYSEAGETTMLSFSQYVGAYPKLEVTYVTESVDRETDLHENAAENTTPLGTETADNITLETLKCMYADETLSFLVNGDSGANVTMELYNKDGAILETHSDSVRTDNIYSWQVSLSSNYSGFVRAHDSVNDLWSEWVSVQPSPSTTQANNQVYAVNTNYPQWTYPFSNYVVYDNDLMYVHWKTNIDPSTELADYSLQILSNGSTNVYEKTLSELQDYYGGTTANIEKLAHWRYCVFSPAINAEGFNDYTGIVQDLNLDSARSLRTGFIQARIVQSDDSVTELAGTHSAYWYLSEVSQGLGISLESSTYTDESTPVILFNVGGECKAETTLPTGNIEAVNGTTIFTTLLGSQKLVISAIKVSGNNTVSIILSGDHTYQYRYDLALSIDGESVGGTGISEIGDPNNILGLLKKILGFINADTAGEKWIWLLVGMGLLVGLFWWSSVLRVVMPMILFGAACVSSWIDPWWVILLALGAGVYLFSIFKKKTSGSEE
jgi:hypothetical protein